MPSPYTMDTPNDRERTGQMTNPAREHLQPSPTLPQCRETVQKWRGNGGKPGKTRG
ncbi:MAG TPA: hypothetical protein H9863_09230 [Candidatus Odoribacter faecigallinarum]|uniref:Uncharacterized protein n=1 Tax=Candidatus Odoribacter faecigallinarum TaxID=2838706 RepID=A0A9D1V1B9_9BACT|nr:hypothetical protein [Candidatus Odoribacter faecigallinarum]